MRSGSLITARLANEMGRDIFALPGSIHAPLSRGCHRIIKQGAKLVETPDEVLEELGFARRSAVRAAPESKQTVAWDGLDLRNARSVETLPMVQPNLATTHSCGTVATDSGATLTRSAAAVGSTTVQIATETRLESPEVVATRATAEATAAFAETEAPLPAPPAKPVNSEAQRLLAALGHSPTTLEILATRTEMEDAALQTTLLQLELAGQISVLPGGRFMRATHSRPRLDQG
jgi:DNA processing protein